MTLTDMTVRIVRRQRGATMLLTASFMLIVVLFLALVLDTGRLYMEKRRVQRLADLAALDVANRGTLCGSSLASDLLPIAQASVTRNGYVGNLTGSQVQTGYVTTSNGMRGFQPSSSTVDAVKVTITRTVPSSLFAGGLFGQQVTLSANAVAQRSLQAAITTGTNLLTLNSASSPLLNPLITGLFGKSANINLSAVSYQGIANLGITLKDLLGVQGLNLLTADLSVGGINQALATQVTLAQVINASVGLIGNKSGTLSAQLGPLTTGIKNVSLKLSDIVQVNSSQSLNTQVNLADIIMASAYAANGSNALSITPAISIPGLTNIGMTLKVIQPPQTAYGRPGLNASNQPYTQAKTGQIKLLTTASLNLLGLATLNIGVGAGVADGVLWFKSGQCQTLSNPYNITLNGNTAALVLGVGDPVWMAANDSWKDDSSVLNSHPASVNILGGLAQVTLAATLPRAIASAKDSTYTVNSRSTDLPMTQTITSGLSSLANSVASLNFTANVNLLGMTCPNIQDPTCLLVPTVSAVLALVQPLVSLLVSNLLDPLLTLLGINISSMQATLVSISDQGAQLVN